MPLLIIGDFNGHLRCLGYQREDVNGEMIINWMNQHSLTLLNIDEKTKGIVTWQRANQRSTIDYALVNNEMYNMFSKMNIDEEREILDLSDHNLLHIELVMRKDEVKHNKKQNSVVQYYISTKKEHLADFRDEIITKLSSDIEISNMEQLNRAIGDTSELTLKRKYKKRIADKNDEKTKEKPWFTEEIREEIRIRKIKNRAKRNVREEDREQAENEYYTQKKKVQNIIKVEIQKHEKKITDEIRQSSDHGKKLWKYINKLKGKEFNTKEDFIYDEDGHILKQEEERNQLKNFWTGIYQKHENTVKELWNNVTKQRYEEELLEDNSMQIAKYQKIPKEIKEHMDAVINTDEILTLSLPPIFLRPFQNTTHFFFI